MPRFQFLIAIVIVLFVFLFASSARADFDDEFKKDITGDFFKEDFDAGHSENSANQNKKKNSGEIRTPETTAEESKAIEKTVKRSQSKIEREMRFQQEDFQLYLQMQKVSNWLSQWAVWNHRMPSYVEEMNGVIVQLAELVPNNPYTPEQIQVSSGPSTDPDYRYLNQPLNQFYNGEESDGFNPSSFVPNNSYEAYGPKKINVEFNPSLTAETVREWEASPPDSWLLPPGSITAISNNSDLIVVWGAGANGRPIRVPGSKKIRLFVSNLLMEGEADNY